MKIRQILLCMLLACFLIPAPAQGSRGNGGGIFFSKFLSRTERFSLGGYTGMGYKF